MPGRLALVISAGAHAVVATVVAARAFTSPVISPEPRPAAQIEVVTITPDEVAVMLVTLPDPIAPPEQAPLEQAPPRPAIRRDARIETGRPASSIATGSKPARPEGATTGPSEPPTGPTGPTRPTGPTTGTMRMRGHDLRLPEQAAAEFIASSKPVVETPRSGKLEQRGREHVVNDLVTTMKVHEDGHVTFKDKADADIRLGKSGDGNTIVDRVSGYLPVLGGNLDITAMAMRKFGMDPYASRKLKLLDETREERAAIGAAYTAKQLDRSSELMQRNVERLWRATPDPVARRQALFALWDECTEGNSARGAAGTRARAIVIGWIRAQLPAGSATAFTDAEIAAFDRRRTSTQHFVPY